MSTSSNSGRVEAVQTVHNMTRNLFPVMKKLTQLSSSDLQSQFDIRSADKSTRKIGFPVNRRVGGVGHLKTKVTKDRASDGFMDITHRNKTSTSALQGSRKSVKPNSRTTLQTFMAHRNSKSKSINSLDKSLDVTSSRRVKLITSGTKTSKSIVTQEDVTEGANSGEHGDNMKPEMLKTTSSKKSNCRKSYTSSLIFGSKYIKAEKEEKLPDIDDKGNPLEVAEYVDDIYQYYWITEVKFSRDLCSMLGAEHITGKLHGDSDIMPQMRSILVNWLVEAQSTSLENYMVMQTDIMPQMRSMLVNWLVEVHFKFYLMPETLYLAVAVLERYLSLVPITKGELQLTGLASLLLASKYEDFWHPRVRDLISISAESYTRKQIPEMENDIIGKLKFRLNLPIAYVFMLRFLKASKSGKKVSSVEDFVLSGSVNLIHLVLHLA